MLRRNTVKAGCGAPLRGGSVPPRSGHPPAPRECYSLWMAVKRSDPFRLTRWTSWTFPVVRGAVALCALMSAWLVCAPASAKHTIRFATIAPRASTWGKFMDVWQRAVDKYTEGQLEPVVYYNGIQGDESAMVAKLRTGQLDGAALSAAGLSLFNRDVMVLQLPGVTNSWPLSDLVRKMLEKEVLSGFSKSGVTLTSWGSIGLVRQMSHGVAVRGPKDLIGRRPLAWRNEPIGPIIYPIIGNVVPVPLGSTEVLPALRAGTVDILAAPALAAEQLQWTPYLDHINSYIAVCAIGATVFRTDSLERIPAELRQVLESLHRKTNAIQTKRIRELDEDAAQRLMRKMTVVHSSDEDKIAWYRVFLKAVRRMRHGIFSKRLLDRVLYITGKG